MQLNGNQQLTFADLSQEDDFALFLIFQGILRA